MTNRDVVVRIRRLVDEARDLLSIAHDIVSIDSRDFMSDIRNRYTLRHLIIELVEVCTLIGYTVLREIVGVRNIEGYTTVYSLLLRHNIIALDTYNSMKSLVGLRNMIIHRYWRVDDLRIYSEARENGLKSIEKYLEEVLEYVSRRISS